MGNATASISILTVAITAGVSAAAALITVFITYFLTRRREHEADWRRLKLDQYKEFVLALSGVVREQPTIENRRRYADAVNAMSLIAPMPVLRALHDFQREISFMTAGRADTEHERLLGNLLRIMRKDVQHTNPADDPSFEFRLLGLPPDSET